MAARRRPTGPRPAGPRRSSFYPAAFRDLRSIADEFGPRKAFILDAASIYEDEVRTLIAGLPDVPSEREFPDSVPPAEMRMRQISTLENARNLEERAIEALKRAL